MLEDQVAEKKQWILSVWILLVIYEDIKNKCRGVILVSLYCNILCISFTSNLPTEHICYRIWCTPRFPYQMKFTSNTMGGTSGAGTTANLCRNTWVFCGVHIAKSWVFSVVFCRSLFVILLLLAIVLSVHLLFVIILPVLLRFMASEYSFGVFKLFFLEYRCLFFIVLSLYWLPFFD